MRLHSRLASGIILTVGLFVLANAGDTSPAPSPSATRDGELLNPTDSSSFSNALVEAGTWIEQHPIESALLGTGAALAGSAFFIPPVLGVLGFGAFGPAAGGAAAGIQSGIGAVAAGSPFAWAQSVAMGGAAWHGVLATGITGVSVAGTGGILAAVKDMNGEKVLRDLKKMRIEAGQGLEQWTGQAVQNVGSFFERLAKEPGPTAERASLDIEKHLRKVSEDVRKHLEEFWRSTRSALKKAGVHAEAM